MPLDLDVIINVGFDGLPFGDDVALGRQRFERRPVQLLEQQRPAAFGTLAERPGVQPIE